MVCPVGFAKIYRWKDADGNLHFSDKPQKGATEVHLPKPQTFKPPVNPDDVPSVVEQLKNKTAPAKVYQSLTIMQPKDDQAVRSNNGNVAVQVKSDPEMRDTDELTVYLDGELKNGAQNGQVINLEGLDRGTHTLQAKIMSQSGETLIESNTISFHLLRHHAKLKSRAVISSSDGRRMQVFG